MTPQSLIVSIDAISQEQLRGQRVLVRIDAQDVVKLNDALPTLVFLSQSGARVVVATHSPVEDIFALLTRLIGHPVGILDEWKDDAGLRAIAHLLEGEITMMKDLALEPGEETNDNDLADSLSHLCDIYCNEAFALSHELRASTVGVASKARLAVAGRAFHRDLLALEAVLDEPRKHVPAILGGVLTKDKLLLAEQIAKGSDPVLIAGQLCFPFLSARGVIFDGAAEADPTVPDLSLETKAISAMDVLIAPAEETLTDVRLTSEVTTGRAFAEILNRVRERRCDLVALGAKDITLLEETVVGSTSEHVVKEAPCSVLIVRN